jgi:hypothetical protein
MENFVNKKDRATAKQQQRLEFQAARRVVSWTGLKPNDYDFRGWAVQGSKESLRAGCVYEYARESRKLRCLLVLTNFAFQKAKLAEKTHSRPPFQGLKFLSLSFEGLRYKDALLQLGGWFGWLRQFTEELADNKSFAELCKENRERLDESLSTLPKYFYTPRAVELTFPTLNESRFEPRLLWPWQAPDVRHRNIDNDVIITIRIRLRDFTNKEIGKAMEGLASMLRPSTEKEPTRKGTSKRDSPRSWLDALSAMRLASHHPKTLPLLPESIRRKTRKRWPHGTDTAVSIFDKIRLGRIQPASTKRKIHGELGHNEFDRWAAHARRQFARSFPFGEAAANGPTWAQRQAKPVVV